MSTVANVYRSEASHFYWPDGRPCYEVENKSKGGMRATTLRDCKSLGLLPSVTTILRCLHSEGLVRWRVEQACLACLTAPRLADEQLDAFVDRVLNQEKQHEEEADKARALGTDIHNGMEALFSGGQIESELERYCLPAYRALLDRMGSYKCATETILVGDGYAGKLDLRFKDKIGDHIIVDFKSASKLPPKTAYAEAKLQLAAYAKAWENDCIQHGFVPNIKTENVYISTTAPGQFVIHKSDWYPEYSGGFLPLLHLWQHLNDYRPVTNMVCANPAPTFLGAP